MSDPVPAHLRKKPPRAEPLQPDRLGSGNQTEKDAKPPMTSDGDHHEQPNTEQADTALQNVNEGYGG